MHWTKNHRGRTITGVYIENMKQHEQNIDEINNKNTVQEKKEVLVR